MKKLRVTVEGKSYDVAVEILEEGAPIAPPATSAPSPATISKTVSAAVSAPAPAPSHVNGTSAGPGDVTSPLAGKLVSIDVTIGQAIEQGAQVATIEAMKMNTYIFAPKSGKVTAVLGKPGDGVQEGAVLLRIG